MFSTDGCFISLVIWSFVAFFTLRKSDGCDAPPLEEGQTGSLTCRAPSPVRNLTWQLQRDGKYVDVSICDIQRGCHSLLSTFSANSQNSSGGTGFESFLTILNANRSESVFKCVTDGGVGEIVCKIEIYVKPETPTCNTPVIHSDYEVAVSCNTSRVYPDAVCIFSYLYQSVLGNIVGRIVYQHSPSPKSKGDNATVCTLIMEVTGFKSGGYQLSLDMFPKLTKVPALAVVTINTVPAITLRTPSVVIADDCPRGPSINGSYIDARYAARTTCRCELAYEGFPPGQALWYDRSGYVMGVKNTGDRSSNVTLSYNASDPSPVYECRASTVLNTTATSVTYRPKYAIGPNTVSIDVLDQDFDLCPSKSNNITVTCTVLPSQVNPEPTFSILVDSQIHTLRQAGRLQPYRYTYLHSFRPQSGGYIQVTCRAENSLFFDAQTSATAKIQVREPPTARPRIFLSPQEPEAYQKTILIESGSSITLTCLVDGGSPIVQSVTLECGTHWQQAQGNRATLVMTASESLDGITCHCKAIHTTNCYDQVREIILRVETKDKSDSLSLTVGLGLGLGAVAVSFTVIIAILLCRRRNRRPSQPPTYVTEWVNNPNNDAPSLSVSLPGYSRYATAPPYAPPEPPYIHIYDEINPSPDYLPSAAGKNVAPRGHRNAGFNDGYIDPLP